MRWLWVGALAAASSAAAWGTAGHEIVATIAQTLLDEPVRARLCELLPATSSYEAAWPGAQTATQYVRSSRQLPPRVGGQLGR